MDVDTEPTEVEPKTGTTTTTEQPKTPRRRSRASSSSAKTAPRTTARSQRRADATKETLQELIRLGKPNLDVEGLTFLEVVDRDAAAWGRFVAQACEWFAPLGGFVDLLFGAPLLAVIGIAPSVRAARRDLSTRRERARAERAAAAEQAALEAEQTPAPSIVPDFPPES